MIKVSLLGETFITGQFVLAVAGGLQPHTLGLLMGRDDTPSGRGYIPVR